MEDRTYEKVINDSFDSLQAECKYRQNQYNYYITVDSEYVIVHCDGRSFSKLIKNKFAKPFDQDFVYFMNETAKYVASKISGCVLAYVQSDEITFILHKGSTKTQPFFGNRLCKMQSIIASMCTGKFLQLVWQSQKDRLKDILVEFDCKVWPVPKYRDVIKWLVYRQRDCVRNSKLQTAQTYLSNNQLMNKSAQEAIELLKEKTGRDWSTQIDKGCKIGRMVHKIPVECSNEWCESFVRNEWTIFDSVYWDDKKQLEEFEQKVVLTNINT